MLHGSHQSRKHWTNDVGGIDLPGLGCEINQENRETFFHCVQRSQSKIQGQRKITMGWNNPKNNLVIDVIILSFFTIPPAIMYWFCK